MTKKKIISKYSVLVFFFVSLILSLFSFSKSYYIDWMLSIGDFTSNEMGSNVFWGVIYPTLYLFILWKSAK